MRLLLLPLTLALFLASWSGVPAQGRAPDPAAAVVAVAAAAAAEASPGRRTGPAPRRARTAVEVVVSGLPRGFRSGAVLRGRGTAVPIRSRSRTVRVRPGRYRVEVAPARAGRGAGRLEGMVAHPDRRRYGVRVRAGRTTVVRVRYGTVMARNVVSPPRRGLRVVGSRTNPRAVVVPWSSRYQRGQYLTSGPTTALPAGLVAAVTSVRRSGRTVRLGLRPANLFEVVPRAEPTILDDRQVRSRGRAARRAAPFASIRGASLVDLADAFPCKLSTGVSLPGPRIRWQPTMDHVAWDDTGGAAQFAAELSVTAGVTSAEFLRPDESISCSADIRGGSVAFPLVLGAVVIPMYYRTGGLSGSLQVSNTGAGPMGLDFRFTLGVELDTTSASGARFVARSVGQNVTGDLARPDVALSFGVPFSLGVGFDGLAGARFEVGPEVVFSAQQDSCGASIDAYARGAVEFLLFEESIDFARQRVWSAQPLPGCEALDPIVGDWSRGEYSVRIQPAGQGSFTATVLTPYTIGDCTAVPAGATVPVRGEDGAYTWPFYLYDDDCALTGQDPEAEITLDPRAPLSFQSCAEYPGRPRQCGTFVRRR